MTNLEAQAAVIAEILSKAIVPHSEEDTSTRTLLEIDQWGGSFLCVFQKWTTHHLVQSEDGKVDHATPTSEVMDRLCAAWIAWRVKTYKPPMTADEALGDLDDHPF